ncbi:hypothetical protein [Chroococcidiopsis cubana]|nr:hypothetical protein [Chroococcidiopsis cubana]
MATPLRDAAGVRQGIVLAHLNLDRIDRPSENARAWVIVARHT